VRAGKSLELRLDELDEGRARERVDAMCRQLLANPVIKEYRYDRRTGRSRGTSG
jgi:phosphoribosylformylglycinamidine synthase PurS subunit